MSNEQIALKQKLTVGQFFAIKKWITHYDKSYVGYVLLAHIIDYPFVRVKIQDAHWSNGRPLTINLEDVEIKMLSDEFVDSVKSEGKQHA